MAGEHSTPKQSRSEYYKAWRAANKEKLKADGAAYYLANKERMNADAAARYRADPDSYKARAAKWVKENKERRYEIVDKWRKGNPESCAKWRASDWTRNKPKRQAGLKKYRAKNPEKIRAINVAWRAKNPEANAHNVGLRRTRRIQAQPAWADLTAIKAIYKRAAELSKATGVAHEVDHEVPLKHPLVCGLHNEFNLRAIPARENQSKGNKFEV